MKVQLLQPALAPQKAQACQQLYDSDPSSRLAILKALAQEEASPNMLDPQSPNASNALCLLCLKFPGASEETEPLIVASFILIVHRHNQTTPTMWDQKSHQFTEDLPFCATTLIALSLFKNHLHKRWQRGAPSPEFYRQRAQSILSTKTKGHRALSAHHQRWESFLGEHLGG
jgi:hypothetical protein